jgi:uncharacterized protein
MANLQLDENQAAFQIRAYQPGTLQINDKTLTTSAIVTPDTLLENWQPQTASELTDQSFEPIFALKPDILLIGTGETHILLAVSLYGNLINAGIGVEIMSTSAACRTYNALAAEGRRVAAALIIK